MGNSSDSSSVSVCWVYLCFAPLVDSILASCPYWSCVLMGFWFCAFRYRQNVTWQQQISVKDFCPTSTLRLDLKHWAALPFTSSDDIRSEFSRPSSFCSSPELCCPLVNLDQSLLLYYFFLCRLTCLHVWIFPGNSNFMAKSLNSLSATVLADLFVVA